jgi:hypothetical protein
VKAGLASEYKMFFSIRVRESLPVKAGFFKSKVGRCLVLTSLMLVSACATSPAPSIPVLSEIQIESRSKPQANHQSATLREKGMQLEALIQRQHLTPEGLLAYGIGLSPGDPGKITGMGYSDMAIWTGCYVASESFRYAVTGEEEAKEQSKRAMRGLHLLQAVTGKTGLLARGMKKWSENNPERGPEWHRGTGRFSEYQWLGDVSADQIIGVIFGYSVAFDLIDEEELRRSIAMHVSQLADHLIDHNMMIIDVDGERTKHGDLGSGFFSEPLNALIALAIMKSAYHITQKDKYQRHYLSLISDRKYHLRAIKARDPWWEAFTGVNHSDNNLAFLAYITLMRNETDPELLDYYQKSLKRAWNVVRNEGNPLFTIIYHALSGREDLDHQAMEAARTTLHLFPVDRRNHKIVNSGSPELCKSFWRDRFGRKQSCRPVPMDRRPADVFEWKENPYRLDGGGDGTLQFSGVDFLLPYWMGRYYGFISE